MSNKGINLLVDKRHVKPAAPLTHKLKIMRFSGITILFCVGLSSVLLSILIVFSPLPQLRDIEQKSIQDLQSYNTDINKLAFINERGNQIRQIINKRPLMDKKLNLIQSNLPANITFDGFTMERKNFTLSFSSDDLSALDGLVNKIASMTGKGREFNRVFLNSIAVDEDKNKFILTIDLEIV